MFATFLIGKVIHECVATPIPHSHSTKQSSKHSCTVLYITSKVLHHASLSHPLQAFLLEGGDDWSIRKSRKVSDFNKITHFGPYFRSVQAISGEPRDIHSGVGKTLNGSVRPRRSLSSVPSVGLLQRQ